MFRCSFRVLLGCRGFWLRAGSKNQREHVTPLKNTWEHQTRVKANVRQKFNLSNVEDGSSLMWATLPLTTSIWGMVHTIHYWVYHILTGLKHDDSRLSPKRPCLCRRTFYRPTNWGRVGWGVIAFVTTARHDVMLRYAFVTTARHDVRRRYAFVTTARHDVRRRYAWGGVGWGGVGWGVIAFVTTARHDVMLRYAFVTTARHDVRRRYAWGGVGCDSIRHYCKSKANAMVCCSNTFEVTNGDGNTLASTCWPPLAKL